MRPVRPADGRAPAQAAPQPDGAAGRSWLASARRAGPVRRSVLLANLLAAAAVVLLLLVDVLRPDGAGGDGSGPSALRPLAEVGYTLEMVSGKARVERGGEQLALRSGALSPGDRLLLGAGAQGRLAVGRAGSIVLQPGSRLQVQEAEPSDEAEWRLFLERGEMTASIFAAPRLFQVGTPSGIAVDLGCFYTARVDGAGVTTLSVRGGRVAFEAEGRQAFVPAGAAVVAHPGHGPGTPVWDDAPLAFAEAVARLDRLRHEPPEDELSAPDADALAQVVGQPGARTSLTLWHLLRHPWTAVRERALGRLLELAPPPANLPRDRLAAGDADALDSWRSHLDDGW